MNIVLIGFRAAGKSTISKILQERLSMDVISTDKLIEEREKLSIKEIAEQKGWKYFREVETKIISEISEKNNCIIDTGAGAIEEPINIDNLKKNGYLVFVYVSLKDNKTRIMKNPNRPKLNPLLNLEDDISVAYNRRLYLYEEAMDFKVNASKYSAEECAEQIIKQLENF